LIVSRIQAVDEWDLIVPGDDAELVAEFHRHGVQPGQLVDVAVVDRNGSEAVGEQLPSFFASFDGPADLAERSGEILRSEFSGAGRFKAGFLAIVSPTADGLTRAAELVEQYADLPLDAPDACIIALAERLNITELVTLDQRHFNVVRPRHVQALTLTPDQRRRHLARPQSQLVVGVAQTLGLSGLV
jgi:predicted nucleic acid-binding protein